METICTVCKQWYPPRLLRRWFLTNRSVCEQCNKAYSSRSDSYKQKALKWYRQFADNVFREFPNNDDIDMEADGWPAPERSLDAPTPADVQPELLPDKLYAAKCLAEGSFGTARDFGISLVGVDDVMAEEFKRLALNFQRIAELIDENGG